MNRRSRKSCQIPPLVSLQIVLPAKNFIVMVWNEVSYHFGHPIILGILVPRLGQTVHNFVNNSH